MEKNDMIKFLENIDIEQIENLHIEYIDSYGDKNSIYFEREGESEE